MTQQDSNEALTEEIREADAEEVYDGPPDDIPRDVDGQQDDLYLEPDGEEQA